MPLKSLNWLSNSVSNCSTVERNSETADIPARHLRGIVELRGKMVKVESSRVIIPWKHKDWANLTKVFVAVKSVWSICQVWDAYAAANT